MKTPARVLFSALIVAIFCLLSSGAAAAPAPPDGWQTVDAGFTPQVLLGHAGAMWAAGSGETIAASTDAGEHWTVKHHDASGSLLLVLHFVDSKFGFAAGTGGKVLFTEDSGETWSSQKVADETILQAAFGDTQHGVIRTLSALLATSDGGKTWHPIVPQNDADWARKYRSTLDLAALDKDHLAALVGEGELGGGEYLWSSDGGTTWTANGIPSVTIHNLIVVDGAYWSIGTEVMGKDKPGGGYGVAMSFRSRDGNLWDHISLRGGACKSEECGGCTDQGCFAGKSSFIQFGTPKDWLAKFPAHDSLSDQWARLGNSLCILSRGAVECASLHPVDSLDTSEDTPSFESRSDPPLGALRKSTPQCIRCALLPFIVTKTGTSGPVDVQISFVLEPSGLVDHISITGQVPADVVEQMQAKMAGWLFEPITKDGIAVPVQLSTRGRVMVINPDKPPSRQ
jgi:hypothetical protein